MVQVNGFEKPVTRQKAGVMNKWILKYLFLNEAFVICYELADWWSTQPALLSDLESVPA